MDKYALGTVLGTVVLALAKSKLGSGVRLRVQEFLEIKSRYILEFNPDDLANEYEAEDEDEQLREARRIADSIIDEVLTTKNLSNGAEITGIKYVESYHSDGDYGHEIHVVIDVYVTIKKPEEAEIDRIVEQIDSACEDMLYLKHTEEGKLIRGFLGSISTRDSSLANVYHHGTYHYSVPAGERIGEWVKSQVKKVIVDADTGELHKIPKSKNPKLRKR